MELHPGNATTIDLFENIAYCEVDCGKHAALNMIAAGKPGGRQVMAFWVEKKNLHDVVVRGNQPILVDLVFAEKGSSSAIFPPPS
ncbi:MAG: hypothetical protein RIG68_22020 [Imperialibacter sp.]|uniref:hypothetical protein n=1 Tax=Imperialibacter sp. TaxID=2038411 RepID=UPI0032EB3AD0